MSASRGPYDAGMANKELHPENLRPVRTTEEAAELGRRGGLASGRSRRLRSGMAALANLMLDSPIPDGQARRAARQLFPDVPEERVTQELALLNGQMDSARKGNTRAAEFMLALQDRGQAEAAPERPYRMDPLDLTRDFVEPYRAIRAVFDGRSDLREVIARGGRGGAKSSFFAEVAYEVMRTVPGANVVYTRRYKTDLRATVYNQFCRVIAKHGDQSSWECGTSPLQCTYLPTGCRVYFAGADNPLQAKSFTPESGYVALLIAEEADEMAGVSQLDDAEMTYLRAGGHEGARQLAVKIFNPPASKRNFMNVLAREKARDPHCLVFEANYLHVPREWLGERFFEQAAWMKRHRPEQYRNKLMGEVTGTGGELFANVREVTFTDAQIKAWDATGGVLQGIDWGYEHPNVFVRVMYDGDADVVRVLFEKYQRRCNAQTFQRGIRRFRLNETICDSAEPDKIEDVRDLGWNAVAATKAWRGGGRSYGWEWLRSVSSIEVDPERTPNLARELQTLEFETLRDGTVTSAYPDVGEDGVMATIYALNRVIRGSKSLVGFDGDEG